MWSLVTSVTRDFQMWCLSNSFHKLSGSNLSDVSTEVWQGHSTNNCGCIVPLWRKWKLQLRYFQGVIWVAGKILFLLPSMTVHPGKVISHFPASNKTCIIANITQVSEHTLRFRHLQRVVVMKWVRLKADIFTVSWVWGKKNEHNTRDKLPTSRTLCEVRGWLRKEAFKWLSP